MRYAFKAVDFGATIVFMAMCAKAFWRNFYNDVEQRRHANNPPSLVPAKVIKYSERPKRRRF
jgi:hypothetical protein